MGFTTFQEPMARDDHKVRGKPERFADHYTQATLFFNSQTPVEQQHIINAFRFELTKVQVPAIRERMVAGLMNVDMRLAKAVADGLGITEMPEPLPKVLQKKVKPEVTQSKSLSLFARPGDGSDPRPQGRDHRRRRRDRRRRRRDRRTARRRRRGAGDDRRASSGACKSERRQADRDRRVARSGAVGGVRCADVPDGEAAASALAGNGRVLEFIKDTYRHCKPILAIGAASHVLEAAGVPLTLPSGKADPGLLFGDDRTRCDAFVTAIAEASPLRARDRPAGRLTAAHVR